MLLAVAGIASLGAWLLMNGIRKNGGESEKSAYDSGMETFSRGEFDESIRFLEDAVEQEESFDAYVKLAVGHYNKRQYDEAIQYYEKAIDFQGGNALIYNGMANAYRDKKQFKEAEAMYQKAIESDNAYALAYSNWAIMHIDSGSMDRAREIVEEGLRNIPDSKELHNISQVIPDK